jgi:KDO2-lipid IV(A) lauroyltransferase
VTYRAWWLVSAIVRRLPPGAAYAVATLLGTASYYLWPRGRRSMLRNYRRVLGQEAPAGEISRVARRSLVNYCRYLADFVRFPSLSPAALIARVSGAEGFARVDAALARGKGAIVVCMHFGNWDMGAGAAAARGYPLTVVAETFSDERLDAMVVGARERLGMKVLKMEKAGPSLVRTLRRNGVLALLIDRPVPGDGVQVQFFGEDVEVPAGPARLALRTGAAIVPFAFARVRPGSADIVALADFEVSCARTGDDKADVRALTQSIMRSHERFIRERPDQWYMFREMWPRGGVQAAASAT